MSIVLVGSTSGSITLQEPAIAGTTTLNLPATSGTLVTTGSPQSGSVIQTVSTVFTSAFSTTSTTAVATGLNLSITPRFSTSKILIIVTANCRATGTGSNAYFTPVLIRNTSTPIWDGYIQGGNFGSSDFRSPATICYLDSPATTSSTNYALYLAMLSLSSGAFLNNSGGTSSITLMEIAG
jgi:hypothetical protein